MNFIIMNSIYKNLTKQFLGKRLDRVRGYHSKKFANDATKIFKSFLIFIKTFTILKSDSSVCRPQSRLNVQGKLKFLNNFKTLSAKYGLK